MAKRLFSSAGTRVVVHPDGLVAFLETNPEVRQLMMGTAGSVAAAAQSTADKAQEGAGGRITGYAEAGFTVRWEPRSKRPRVTVRSNADTATATAVHFHTQKRDGVAHLRAALYRYTRRG